MNVLGCLDRPTDGTYTFEGREVQKLRDTELADLRNKRMGFVFQNYSLLQQATALHNVELPLLYGRAPNRRKRALEALERLGVGDRAHHRPSELSGGQQQRVAIARALVNEPSIILADEPTGNLDSKTGAEVMGLFCNLNDQGITVVVVTHDEQVAAYTNRLVEFLDGRVLHDNHGGGICPTPENGNDDATDDEGDTEEVTPQ
jgi:putative ABC transport system ATP-binding protein